MDKELTFNTGYTSRVDEELLEQLRENFEKQVEDYLKISKTIGYECIADLRNAGFFKESFVYDLEDELETEPEPAYDISWIRKRMKHCTNPMERKQLEKQLNAAFKAKKKGRKK